MGLRTNTIKYDTRNDTSLYIVAFVVVLIVLFMINNLIRSKHGRAITAIRDNEIAAKAMGINVTFYKLFVFVFSAFFAGVAGVIYAHYITPVQYSVFSYNYSIEILVMVVLGGMASINGSIVSAALITIINFELQSKLSGDLAALKYLIYALILICLVIFNNAPAFTRIKRSSLRASSWRASRTRSASPRISATTRASGATFPQRSPWTKSSLSICSRARNMSPTSRKREERKMAEYVLETKDLGISFGGLKAVENVDLKIKKKQLYGLVGPNGAGKTTVFNMLTGVYQPTTGTFYLNGEELRGKSQEQINHKGIARTFQNIRLFNNMSVIRNVLVGLHNQPEFKCDIFSSIFRLPKHYKTEKAMRDKAKEILRIFDLYDERNNLACNLPYGKQRKLEIARALATNPCLLLLDEPAAGMNPHETEDLMDIVRRIRDEFDMTILLIEHDMKFVSGLCDEITVLNFGTVLAQGKTEEALSDPEVIKAYIGE